MSRTYSDYEEAVRDLFSPGAAPQVSGDTGPHRVAEGLFQRIVSRKKVVPTQPIVVAGPVRLSDTRFTRTMRFSKIEFEGDVVAEAACFTRLDFIDCTFHASLRLPNCRVAGGLSLTRCDFPALVPAPDPAPDPVPDPVPDPASEQEATRLALDGSRINGRLELAGVTVAGSLSADAVTCRALSMHEVAIGGDCWLASLETRGDFALYETRVEGDLIARFLRCGGLMRLQDGCAVGGEFDLAGVRIASQIDLADGRFAGIYFNGSSVGSMWIGSSGKLHCATIWAIDSEFASYVRMSRLTVGSAALAQTMGSDPAPSPSPASGEPDGPAPAPAAPPAAEPARLSGECGAVTFLHCRFGSEVATWAPQRNGVVDGMQDDNYVAIESGLTLTDCNVAGALNLTRLRVGGAAPRRGGYVRLDRTHLRGPLLISSPLEIANRLEVLAGARARAREAFAAGPRPRYRARMRSLSMRDLSASAVELSGLDLVRAGHTDADSNVDGSLVAERATVAGRFATYVRYADGADAAKEERDLASIEGALRLRAARLGELYLAGESFRKCHACTAQTDGVVLERADIGLLRVPRLKRLVATPQAPEDQNPNDFPVPLDLSGLAVRNWSFGEDVDPEPPVEFKDYLDFLDNDEKLHREVYKSIALSLRDSGRDEDAEHILYAEEYRARWESDARRASSGWPPKGRQASQARNPPSFLSYEWMWGMRRSFEGFERVFLHYRRNTINLLYAILLLFTLSALFVSSHADNFELSDSSRLILERAEGNGAQFARGIDYRIDGANVGADPDHWDFWSGVWMAARYHVPIVSLGARSEYVASNDNPLRVGMPGWSSRWTFRISGFTAEDWFGLMSIFNWVMWPLLLTFALRRALRSD